MGLRCQGRTSFCGGGVCGAVWANGLGIYAGVARAGSLLLLLRCWCLLVPLPPSPPPLGRSPQPSTRIQPIRLDVRTELRGGGRNTEYYYYLVFHVCRVWKGGKGRRGWAMLSLSPAVFLLILPTRHPSTRTHAQWPIHAPPRPSLVTSID